MNSFITSAKLFEQMRSLAINYIGNSLFFILFTFKEKVFTKPGNSKGSEREDLVNWVVEFWQEIGVDILRNLFGKSKLLKVSSSAEQKNPNIERANEVVYNLDYFDIDKPYLDEMEQKSYRGVRIRFKWWISYEIVRINKNSLGNLWENKN